MSGLYKALLQDRLARISGGLFAFFIVWWAALQILDSSHEQFQVWAALYQLIALYGGIVGFFIAKQWGGFRSMMGRAILMFSIGLLCESFAQIAGSYLVWSVGTVPYPSLSDVGAFGALIFYAAAVTLLAYASGAHVSLRGYKGKLLLLLIPFIILGASYTIFLRTYDFDWSQPLITFLDIGYPLGEAIYVSIAILAYLLSRNTLGGVMRIPILFFIAALVSEYTADFLFLYNAHAGTPYVLGCVNDLLFIVSYALMAISLIQLGVVSRWINES